MFTFQALQILLFLIPGFMASQILGMLVVRSKAQNELVRIVEALIFSMLIYAVFAVVAGYSPVSMDQTNNTISYSFEPWPFIALIAISIIMPIILSFFMTRDWHMKFARKLGASQRTSRSSVWFDVFYDFKCPVIIDFANGRRLYGWPMYYSDDPENPYLFISNPYWIEDNEFVQTGLVGMLVTPEQKIDLIEFVKK